MFGLFVIEAGSEPVALLNIEGKPVVASTGAEAADVARRCGDGDYYHAAGYAAIKVQPRRLASDAWKARELGRFADGTYIALPWADLPKLTLVADHFAHISTEDGAKIAYTQDATKGAGDIQTRVKPGKYLQQFYGEVYDAATIARMSAEFSNQYGESNVLLFADTEDAIEHVYQHGPHSCMAHAASHFDSSVHPCRIYAAGDLAVAYMVRNDEITARALCWPSKKIYGRIYGDETRLTDLLESASFREGDLNGARLLRIEEQHGGFVMPYIDGDQNAGDNGKFLILGGNGVDASNQNGLSGPRYTCEACGEGVDEDDCQSDDNGNSCCQSCYNDRFSYCEHYSETCDSDTVREVIVLSRRGGTTAQFWGERAQDNDAFTCEGNGKLYCNALCVTLADGTTWSQDHFEDHGSVCEGDSEAYDNDDMVQLEDGTMWSKDYFADNGVTVDGKLYDKADAPEADAPEADDAEDAPMLSRHFRPSPYVKCDAQLEMPLPVPCRIQGPDDDGDYCVMRGLGRVSKFYNTREAAQDELHSIELATHGLGSAWDVLRAQSTEVLA